MAYHLLDLRKCEISLIGKKNFKELIYLLLEMGKGGRRGEKHQCVREILSSCLLHMPQPGTRPTTQSRALTRRARDLLFCGMTFSQVSHTSQGETEFFE